MSFEKAVAAVGIGAAGSVGTYAMVVRSSAAAEPVLVSEDKAEKTAYSGKVGQHYGYALLAANNADNKTHWNSAFARWQKDGDKANLATNFQNDQITSAWAESNTGTNAKALNQVCKTLYNGEKDSVEPTNGTTDDKTKKQKSLWMYCSPVGKVPKTIKDGGDGAEKAITTGKLGKDEESKLLSAANADNAEFWRLKTKEFFGKTTADLNGHTFFKDFYDNQKSSSLKEKCAAAYKLESTTSASEKAKPTKEETFKYCSLKGAE